jgi:hypothetical protein
MWASINDPIKYNHYGPYHAQSPGNPRIEEMEYADDLQRLGTDYETEPGGGRFQY